MLKKNILNSEKFLENFLNKNSLLRKLRKGSILVVRILQIKKDFVVVDGNLKSESYISTSEFITPSRKLEISVGDYIEVLIESMENDYGNIVLSRFKFKELMIWGYFEKLLKDKKDVEGYILGKVKGGFSVIIKDIKCFLPFSGIDKRVLLNIPYYENRSLYFRIISINPKKKNVILSRKLVVKRILNKKKWEFMKNIKLGCVVKGIVKNITNYGAFIDMGYMDGLVLSKNITWGPYKYPNEILSINQAVMARIIKIDRKKNRIFLGIKQLISDPWKNILDRYKIGCRKFARVNRISSESIHMILEKGIFGYVKKYKALKTINDKSFINKIKVNNYIEVIIRYINISKRFISFDLYYKKNKFLCLNKKSPPLAQ